MSITTAASAAAPFTANKATINARLQYGLDLEEGEGNPYKLGLALGGGYTLAGGLFLGGNFDYFFGEKVETGVPGVATAGVKGNVWQLMGNVGYDLGLADTFVLRPYGGLGLASVNAELCTTGTGVDMCASGSDSYFALAVGAQPIIGLGPAFLLADARFNIIFGDETAKSLLLGVGGGVHF